MLRAASLAIALMGSTLVLASDPNEVLRSREDTYKPLHALKAQLDKLHKLDDKYGKYLEKLRISKPKDYLIQRDGLNELYTREFTGCLDLKQRSTYRKYIRSLREKYIKSHPEVDADNIFIWGGANIV